MGEDIETLTGAMNLREANMIDALLVLQRHGEDHTIHSTSCTTLCTAFWSYGIKSHIISLVVRRGRREVEAMDSGLGAERER